MHAERLYKSILTNCSRILPTVQRFFFLNKRWKKHDKIYSLLKSISFRVEPRRLIGLLILSPFSSIAVTPFILLVNLVAARSYCWFFAWYSGNVQTRTSTVSYASTDGYVNCCSTDFRLPIPPEINKFILYHLNKVAICQANFTITNIITKFIKMETDHLFSNKFKSNDPSNSNLVQCF